MVGDGRVSSQRGGANRLYSNFESASVSRARLCKEILRFVQDKSPARIKIASSTSEERSSTTPLRVRITASGKCFKKAIWCTRTSSRPTTLSHLYQILDAVLCQRLPTDDRYADRNVLRRLRPFLCRYSDGLKLAVGGIGIDSRSAGDRKRRRR
jgi:hypothetical protein